MAHIIDVRMDGFTKEEREALERIGAQFIDTASPLHIALPMGSEAAMHIIDADLIDLMTPPLCPWCRAMMQRLDCKPVYGEMVKHTCPDCGGSEVAIRYPPPKENDGQASDN